MKIPHGLIFLLLIILSTTIYAQKSNSDTLPNIPEKQNSANKLLLAAALHGNVQDIKKAMSRGAEANCKDTNGNTPLNMVAKLSYFHLVKYFVEKGAEVNTTNSEKITPLHYGVEYNNVKIVKLLLEKGANIDAREVMLLLLLQ